MEVLASAHVIKKRTLPRVASEEDWPHVPTVACQRGLAIEPEEFHLSWPPAPPLRPSPIAGFRELCKRFVA